MHTRKEKVSTAFYIGLLISAIAAFVFGFSLGFTSPTFLAQYEGTAIDSEKECILVLIKKCKPGSSGCDYATAGKCKTDGGVWDNSTAVCKGPAAEGKMNCDLMLSDEMSSWFGSLINIGCLFGALMGGSVADKCGKKIGMMIADVIYIVGWLCICLAPTPTTMDEPTVVYMLIASRLLIGFAIGIVCCTVSNYQTETCTTEMRGTVGTVFQIAIVLGLMSAYLVGVVLNDWKTLAWIMTASSALGLVLTPLLNETPTFLLLQGRETEAKNSMTKLRTGDTDVAQAMVQLKADVQVSGNIRDMPRVTNMHTPPCCA